MPGLAQQGLGLAIRLEYALRRSKVKTAAYECKQGLCSLDTTWALSPGMLDKLVEMTCAIANIGPENSGPIFVGIADNASNAARIES